MARTPPLPDVAADSRALDALRLRAERDPSGSARQAARQFEAQFAQTLLSQMRQTSLAGQGGLASVLNSPATQTWRSMLDQQMAQSIAGVASAQGAGPAVVPEHSGLGLADMIEQQLNRKAVSPDSLRGLPPSMSTLELARRRGPSAQPGPGFAGDPGGDLPAASLAGAARRIQSGKFVAYAPPDTPPSPAASAPTSGAASGSAAAADGRAAGTRAGGRAAAAGNDTRAPASPAEIRAEFLGKYLPAARRAEAATGIPAVYILGQAALESGWGRHEIRGSDGRPSHNLFGIKATGWSGRVAEVRTTEYRNGQPERVSARFRAYDSYEDAFEDYARMLASNPRYAGALRASGNAEQFARGLQRAGYATDPRYAEKLASTIRHAMKVVV
ncbi:hypothetical protein GCM10023144_12760 [Pigmentiphaga soli]|uniref:Peptidoglycan hydrolase FlgJ n=1 Tax=Pigmentiphaga soli TaxID=1007095 RepID=A0ABP8GPQ5_9BURK